MDHISAASQGDTNNSNNRERSTSLERRYAQMRSSNQSGIREYTPLLHQGEQLTGQGTTAQAYVTAFLNCIKRCCPGETSPDISPRLTPTISSSQLVEERPSSIESLAPRTTEAVYQSHLASPEMDTNLGITAETSSDISSQFDSIVHNKLEEAKDIKEDMDYICDAYENETKQIEKYFSICTAKLQDCVSKVEKSGGNITSEELNNLEDSIAEAIKATNIIKFRDQYPTAEDLLKKYSPPQDLLEWHATSSSQCWETIARKRSIKEKNGKITDEEFKEYYEGYLRRLDKHALALVEPEDIQICIRRWPHKLLEILECGRIKSMFETQTAGAQTLGKRKQAKVEEACYGFPHDNYLDEWRPLYAYVTKGFYASEDVEGFGATVIKLKPSVRQRTTKIMYDSASLAPNEENYNRRYLAGRPTPFNEPGRDCFSLIDPYHHPARNNASLTLDELQNPLTLIREIDPLEFETANDIKPWFEAEIHGAVTIDDIEEIYFTKWSNNQMMLEFDKKVSNKQEEELRSLLKGTEENEVANIVERTKKVGLIAVIRDISNNKQINNQLRIKLEKMQEERLKYSKRLAEEQMENLENRLKERNIAYSFIDSN